MELAQRIKDARLEAGLSQRQLCGDVITRNMLSLIESGKARPSMDTLRHFAAVLGKPMSYFLEEDAVLSPNQAIMDRAEKAYSDKDFAQVLSLLEQYRAPDALFDNIRYLLEVLSCEALAEAVIAEGKKAYALQLLDRADAAAEHTLYAPSPTRRTILRWQAEPSTAMGAKVPITQALMLRADAAIQKEDYARAAKLLDAAENTPPRWHLLRGTAALNLEDLAAAELHLRRAEATYPAETVPLLELVYLKKGDFRLAYEYAKKQK